MTRPPRDQRLDPPEIIAARVGEPTAGQLDPELRVAELITLWLDRRFLDPLAGLLLPGIGDLVSSALGLYMVALARRRGLPLPVIARMLVNLSVDALLGAVPVLGDIFDVFYRAHVRNLRLLERPAQAGAKAGDWLVVAGAALLFLLAMAVPVTILVLLIRALAGLG